jgi:hypothetical protein
VLLRWHVSADANTVLPSLLLPCPLLPLLLLLPCPLLLLLLLLLQDLTDPQVCCSSDGNRLHGLWEGHAQLSGPWACDGLPWFSNPCMGTLMACSVLFIVH